MNAIESQLIFLIIFAGSLLITVPASILIKDNHILKVYSVPFFIPLLWSGFLLTVPAIVTNQLHLISQTLPFMLLGIIFLFGLSADKTKTVGLSVLLLFTAITSVLLIFPHLLVNIPLNLILPILTAIVLLLILVNPFHRNQLIAGINYLAISGICLQLVLIVQENSIELILTAITYIILVIIFFRQLSITLLEKQNQAEEKLANWNRSVQLEVRRKILELERHNQHLLKTSKIDRLTGIYNKAAITSYVDELINNKKMKSFTILFFDIDNFKQINANKGHVFGDNIIQQVAHIATTCVRSQDMVGRYGGDEFLMVLPGTSSKDASYVGERLRCMIQSQLGCTISAGIAVYPDGGTTLAELIKEADKGLYISKKKGKNLVTYSQSKP